MRSPHWKVLTIGLMLTASTAGAGTIHPALQAEMDRVTADTRISALVYMTEQTPVPQLSEELLEERATRRERHARVVTALQKTSQSQADLLAWLDDRMASGGIDGYTSYWITNLVVVYATKSEIEGIASRADVDLVDRNFTVSLIEPIGAREPSFGETEEAGGGLRFGATPGLRAIRAPEVWNQLGYTGAGRLVANCDTGVDGSHPALATRWRGFGGTHPWQECWLDLHGGTSFPSDAHWHGTHVMGTETGLGVATGDTIGVAWGAKWIACNALDESAGGDFDNDIITSFQWFADPDGDPETVDDVPDVVQNSWGVHEGFGYPDCDARWWAVIDNCEAAGVVTVWSAGNDGPNPATIRSPADRATTATNAFSVGAVNTTDYDWPYPIAGFSSHGPSQCDVPEENRIKPEVVAPGVHVYSSIPGGGYDGDVSGTSVAGPHAAGVVALMREANPNLDVGEIKTILMATARDEGDPGNENTYGWGFVDAYAAVLASIEGFGQVEGGVTNTSWFDTPIEGVTITISDFDITMFTDETGFYQGWGPTGSHTLIASLEGFAPDTAVVVLDTEETVVQDFALADVVGPEISDVTDERATTDTVGPYLIEARIFDYSTVASAKLFFRTYGDWNEVAMDSSGAGLYAAEIVGMPSGTRIDYYVWAEDGAGNEATSPDGAPDEFYSLHIMEELYTYDAEEDEGWQLGHPDDTATTGVWIRADPVGTSYNGASVQPEDDHTPQPGTDCFVTGNGEIGGQVGDNDVDGGCTTLLSPLFDLSGVEVARITYHRWYGQTGAAIDDDLAIDVSNDGGATWLPLERVSGQDNTWRWVSLSIDDLVPLTDQVRFRFVACDLGHAGFVEAAFDDFTILVFMPNPEAVGESQYMMRSSLSQNTPNPWNPTTTISFVLSNPAQASLVIYDVAGRHVRTLVDEPLAAGTHRVAWDGKDDDGRSVGSGVYLYRLKAGAFLQSKRMTILK